MKFTSDELMFLTSITKGPAPFGIFFDKVKSKDGKVKAEAARDELVKKEILSLDGITKKGFAVINLWEEYRNAERFVLIKNSLIGLLDNRRCVVIYRDEKGFEIASGDTAEIMYACLKEYPFLRRADKNYEDFHVKENLDYEGFRTKVQAFGKNVVTFGVFAGNGLEGDERFFYWNEKDIYSYNPHIRIEKLEEPSQIRRYILDSLGISQEVMASGKQ